MSIFHRSAYLTLSALLAIVPAACGDDDDDDNGGGAADSGGGGGQADAGGGTPDAGGGTPDAGGGTPDAAPPIDGQQYLLGIGITDPAAINLRFIATVALGETSADFQLQPIVAPECDAATSGQPIGDAVTVTGVPINADLTFEIMTSGTIPTDANPLTCGDLAGDFDVMGQLQADQTACGTVSASAGPITATGTFGTVAIETGTVGDDNLPDAVFDCP
ncbi:MAG TPA: hypothetical protein VKB80_37545 [Kofleriaceae bacterium]|nr:hypothetical protein [Kofleriaceae bacterium]